VVLLRFCRLTLGLFNSSLRVSLSARRASLCCISFCNVLISRKLCVVAKKGGRIRTQRKKEESVSEVSALCLLCCEVMLQFFTMLYYTILCAMLPPLFFCVSFVCGEYELLGSVCVDVCLALMWNGMRITYLWPCEVCAL
jgi:hypothetical protein